MRSAAVAAALTGALLAAACTSPRPKPGPTDPPPRDGIGITITSVKSEYRRGEPIALSVVLTNGRSSACRISRVAEGSVAILSLTRDGNPVAPVLVNGDYLGGFTEFLGANQVPLAPGASITVPWTSDGGTSPGNPAALPTSTMDTLDRALIGYWPVAEPGRYEVSARYTPSLAGGSADACPGSSQPAQVTFAVMGG
jgi:hypothetical protein